MRNLSKNGLSMSQAQAISNMCNQRALDISEKLSSVNNASKSFKHDEEFTSAVKGTHAQVAFPDMSTDNRERLISGTCPKCWNKMFGHMDPEGTDPSDLARDHAAAQAEFDCNQPVGGE